MDNDGIQHKPAHSGIFFDDQSRPVSITLAHGAQSSEDDMLDSLAEIGVVFPDRAKAAEVIAAGLDRHGDRRAVECLSVVYSRLQGQGKQGALLRGALLSAVGVADTDSQSEQASSFGIARQNWHRAIARLCRRLKIG